MRIPVSAETAQWLRRAAVPVLVSVVCALLSYLALDLVQNDFGLGSLYRRDVVQGPLLTLLGTFVVWVVLVLVWAVAGRLSLAVAVLVSLTVILGYANHMKMTLRLEPILPSDLVYVSQLGFLTEMVGPSDVLLLVVAVALVTVAIVAGARRLTRSRPRASRRSDPHAWRRSVLSRLVAGVLSVSFLAYVGNFNHPGNNFREAYEASGAEWAYWAQGANYLRNGFVGGVLYNLDMTAMDRPPDYTRASMEDIVRRYVDVADRTNRDRRPGVLDDVNIVLVLSESFTDPTKMSGIRLEDDPIPFTRRLMSETTSGTMLAQKYGAGTANMEFEALTGMSMSQFTPQMDSPYQMLVPEYSSFPSAVQLLDDRGHDAVAIHPYTTQLYRRETVYPVLGMDEFISEGEMQSEATIDDNPRISDASAYEEVSYQLERSDRPLLVNLVTMQNHFPSRSVYDDPVAVSGLSGNHEEHVAGYVRGLSYADAALEDFIGELEGSSEKTAVIFYGDHHPPVWPKRIREKNGEVGVLSTPYFLWANFPLDRLPAERLTSPIHFMPMLYDAAGAQVPPYYALLSRLHELVPAMEQGRYLDRGKGLVPESELGPQATQVLQDYRMVQYDLAVGERYSQEALFGSGADAVSAARGAVQQ
ncbi:MAG: LTA synthase family protein [Nocardioidaceae bacterium]|nr:LTA synthase family protein [Nocardioidaceae bacterium]